MTATIGELLRRRAEEGFVGRRAELAALETLRDGRAVVAHVHGIPGIGKSTLVARFLAACEADGVCVVRLDGRLVEPTPAGFLRALSAVLGFDSADLHRVVRALREAPAATVVLAVDDFELLRLLDTWLRQSFVPSLGANIRVVLAGREPPLPGWIVSSEWDGSFVSVPLGPLAEDEALALLQRAGVPAHAARAINRLTRGHPLALRLAAAGARQEGTASPKEAALRPVLTELTRMVLEDVEDRATRDALEAASVVRRTTGPLLRAMLPDAPPDILDRLLVLPFVQRGTQGLVVHGAIQQTVAAGLAAADPERYTELRRAAWHHLRSAVATAGSAELWRYTADMLYLIENPVVREAFFPSGDQEHSVEPADVGDEGAIMAIAAAHEPPAAVDVLAQWWNEARPGFSVARDSTGGVAGFSVLLDASATSVPSLLRDPVTRVWRRHLRDHPVAPDERVLFIRRWLDAEAGDAPSAVQAACWLDMKRTYLALRPALRRVYLVVADLEPYAAVAGRLGFVPLADVADLGGKPYASAVLDFGPGSVDGWLARLVADELGIEPAIGLDTRAGEARIDGRRIRLTKREFGVLERLRREPGRVVTRPTLLRDVWGYEYAGGSNVVDSAVRSLRAKLGSRAAAVETVRGRGYRLRE